MPISLRMFSIPLNLKLPKLQNLELIIIKA